MVLAGSGTLFRTSNLCFYRKIETTMCRQISPGSGTAPLGKFCSNWRDLAYAASRTHVVVDQRRVRYIVGSADEVRRFAPLPRTVYLVYLLNVKNGQARRRGPRRVGHVLKAETSSNNFFCRAPHISLRLSLNTQNVIDFGVSMGILRKSIFLDEFWQILADVAAFEWIDLQAGMIFLIQFFLCIKIHASCLWKNVLCP